MSLHPMDRSKIPEKIAELGRKLLGKNNKYRLIGDLLADLVKDEDFADMYSSIGGPALSPALLSLVLIFQMLEKLPDRLATEAVRLRIDWKYALHLPLDWAGFHFTNLGHFRNRLLKNEAEYRVFERLLEKIVEMGFMRRRGKQRTDSMSVLGLIAKLSRLEMIWETLRMALKAIQAQDETWLEETVPEAYLKQYMVRQHDYDLKDGQISDALRQAGADGLWLLQQVKKGAAELQDLEDVQTMHKVWEQQFEWDEAGEYTAPREKLDAHGLIQSPHEPEVRYRKKRDKSWQGYVGQVTETAEEAGDPNFITDVAATDAQVSDCNALPEIQKRLAERDLTPSEQYVDQAYVSGTRLAESAEQGIRLVGPVANEAGSKEFKLRDFTVDLEHKQATCPEGKQAHRWTTSRRPDGTLNHTAHFDELCASCSSRSRCTDAKAGRTITTHEHHNQVVQRRAEMETAAFWQTMKHRPPVEGTISQLARMGMRHARYRGRRKVNLQSILTATAVNLRRLCRAYATGQKPSWAAKPTV